MRWRKAGPHQRGEFITEVIVVAYCWALQVAILLSAIIQYDDEITVRRTNAASVMVKREGVLDENSALRSGARCRVARREDSGYERSR